MATMKIHLSNFIQNVNALFYSHFKITLVFLVELGLVQLRRKKVRLEGQSLKAVHKNVPCLLLQMRTPPLNP